MMPANSLRLMEALLIYGREGSHREGLMQEADMSTATFYRALEPLLEAGLVRERDSYYCLPLEHPHNFSFKLWNDQARLLKLAAPIREEVSDLRESIQKILGENLQALWFHGSAAQNSLRADSDFDFLAVVRKEAEVDVQGSRPVQTVIFTARRFSSSFSEGDAFLRTVLTHGLLLFDRQFAQEFYAQPMPASSTSALKERGELQEQARSKLFFFLRMDDPGEARRALAQLAVNVTRTMLSELGEVPAGKADLVEVSQLYFGSAFAELVRRCIEKKASEKELLGLSGQLEQWQKRFAIHAGFIKDLAAGLQAPPLQFEVLCSQMLRILSGDEALVEQSKNTDADLTISRGDETIFVEVKSFKRGFTGPGAMRLPKVRPLVVVLNYLKELPPSQRPPITNQQRASYVKLGIPLIDSRELLQLSVRRLLALEPEKPKLEDILPPAHPNGQTGKAGEPM